MTCGEISTEHVPVLLEETIAGLALLPGADCIDGTLGGAGHASAMLRATTPGGRLLGLDLDPGAVDRGRVLLVPFGERVVLAQGNFRNLSSLAALYGFTEVRAILLDLGISSDQLDDPTRGFSFRASGPLDMRLDPSATLKANEIVNEWSSESLADIFYRYGEETGSRQIARAIVAAREVKPLRSTEELAAVVSRAIGGRSRAGRSGRGGRQRIHPATRVFQALRIQVNDELAALEAVLPQIPGLLGKGGRVAIITFHSLEDRIVKQFFQRESRDCLCTSPGPLPSVRGRELVMRAQAPGMEGLPDRWPGQTLCPYCGHRATMRPVNRKPIQPTDTEVRENARSRSAKLRIAERI